MDIMKIEDGTPTRTICDQLYSSKGDRWCQTMIPSCGLKEFVFQMKTRDLILILKLKDGRFLSQNSMYLANFLSIAERWCSASIVGYGKSGLDAQEIVLRVRCSKFRMRNFSCLFNKPQSNQAADAPRRRIQWEFIPPLKPQVSQPHETSGTFKQWLTGFKRSLAPAYALFVSLFQVLQFSCLGSALNLKIYEVWFVEATIPTCVIFPG